jgi:hypothetical protein
MKITKTQLKQIIKEELDTALVQKDNSPPQEDIENALDLLKNAGPGTTFQVIEALQAAIEKLEGQEEPRDPHAHPQGSPHWTEY